MKKDEVRLTCEQLALVAMPGLAGAAILWKRQQAYMGGQEDRRKGTV